MSVYMPLFSLTSIKYSYFGMFYREFGKTYSIFITMKKTSRYCHTLILSLICFYGTYGQSLNFQEGFDYLENGAYQEAELFFEKVLLEDNNNKTAQICYNRALGLQGKSSLALKNFVLLDQQFPEDYEIQLNLAEAYMWNKEFSSASELYALLLKKDANNFVATMGYANALSASNNYKEALRYIEKAIELDPANNGALLSQKFINLGYADRLKKLKSYKESETILLQLDEKYPEDKDVYISIANLYLAWDRASDAQTIFKKMETLDMNLFQTYNGLSYTNLLLHRHKDAFHYAEKAINLKSEDRTERIKSGISYTNALGINNRYSEAISFLEELEENEGSDLQIDMAKARMKLWNRSFNKAYEEYTQLEKQKPNSFEVKMGVAETLVALKKKNKAKAKIREALILQPGQADAERLLDKLKLESRPLLHFFTDRNTDIGDNNSTVIGLDVKLNHNERFTPRLYVNRKNTTQPISNSANVLRAGIGNSLQLRPSLKLITDLGAARISSANVSGQEFLYKAAINGQLGKALNLELGINRDIQDYNSDLIDNTINLTNYYLSYNFNFSKKLGAYSQFIRTSQNDSNKRNLIFASLYYSIRQYPNIKLGVDFLSFEFLFKSADYFSPDYYQNIEGFLQVSNIDYEKQSILYDVFIAIGKQKIENESSQSTRRIELKAGYRFNPKTKVLLSFLNSNASKVSAVGFSFTNIGLDLHYYL